MEIRQRLDPSSSGVDSQLALIAVVGFSVVQFLLAFFAVNFCTHVLGFSPSRAMDEAPAKMLAPSGLYLLLAMAGVFVFRRFLRTDLWRRSPYFSDWRPRTLLLAFGFGLMPVILHTLIGVCISDAHLSSRPLESGAILPLFLFIIVCGINAAAEELAFRATPISLLLGIRPIAAFLVPVTVFVLGHFLEPQRAFSVWRAVELGSASLLFFLIAIDYGLGPSILTHTALNLAYALTSGTSQAGGLLEVHWTGSSPETWLIGDCAGIWAATVVYLAHSLLTRRKRARGRDFTLSLTPA